jgi:hypothetical protein
VVGKYIDELDRKLNPDTPAERSLADQGEKLSEQADTPLGAALSAAKDGWDGTEQVLDAARDALGEDENRFDAAREVLDRTEGVFGAANDMFDGTQTLLDSARDAFNRTTGPETGGSVSGQSEPAPAPPRVAGSSNTTLVPVEMASTSRGACYVVRRVAGQPDRVWEVALRAYDDTVSDAIGQVPALPDLTDKELWISRAGAGGQGGEQILPIDWNSRTKSVSPATDYRITSGDRIVIANRSAGAPNADVWR